MISSTGSSILTFNAAGPRLEVVGGKGLNLMRLTRAGFRVPPGFILAVDAYRQFVQANQLEPVIESALYEVDVNSPGSLEIASDTIRAAFTRGGLPASVETELRNAYQTFADQPVAVRSSATAEDLPDLSFAGQQDTCLNVVGWDQLVPAVIHCWGSLWTARAIGYRLRNQIAGSPVGLAVVVQRMVSSDVSGVLFTANPLSGLVTETVIDATYGLGEALVSGKVEPDHVVVDSQTLEIKEYRNGQKGVITRGLNGGDVETVVREEEQSACLTAAQAAELTAVGQKIQAEYGSPQDIEWAIAQGELYILQARAVTSLFPVPYISLDPLELWFSFGAVQGLVGPITPLGQDSLRRIVLGVARLFGEDIPAEERSFIEPAGERLWINSSGLLRNPLGRKVSGYVLTFVEPSVAEIVKQVATDPRFAPGAGRPDPGLIWSLARVLAPIFARAVRTMLAPRQARADFTRFLEDRLAKMAIPEMADPYARLAHISWKLKAPGQLPDTFRVLLPRFLPVFGPAMAGLNFLLQLVGDQKLVLEITRAVPGNVTTEMDLELWRIAHTIQIDPVSWDHFLRSDARELTEDYCAGRLPAEEQHILTEFLDRFGMRGVGEIDIGQPRWNDQPLQLIQILQSYLQIPPDQAPDVVYQKGQAAAEAAVERIVTLVRARPGGWLRARQARFMAERVRLLIGLRESPKFFAVRGIAIMRRALMEIGACLVQQEIIRQADDLMYLNANELAELAQARGSGDWMGLIARRRATYQKELLRRQVPRVLISDGRAFYDGLGAVSDNDQLITGSPVSPGVVEGRVRVVLDPRATQLLPGEILVCPGTDPAWTPLFLSAGGLITEVGGMMTHGSVVAREYGIPAVVGVHEATTRLKDGQMIRVDGSSGQIVLL